MATNMSEGGGAKELFHTIVKHPPLLIAILVGGGLVVYFLIKNGPQSQQSPASTGLNASPSSDYNQGFASGYQYGYTIPSIAQQTAMQAQAPSGGTSPIPDHPTTTTTVTTPVPTTTINANNRQHWTPETIATLSQPVTNQGAWGYNPNKMGIPVRATPGGDITNWLPYGTQMQVKPTAISGPNNFAPNAPAGSNVWYQLQSGGYVSGFDVQDIQATSVKQ